MYVWLFLGILGGGANICLDNSWDSWVVIMRPQSSEGEAQCFELRCIHDPERGGSVPSPPAPGVNAGQLERSRGIGGVSVSKCVMHMTVLHL